MKQIQICLLGLLLFGFVACSGGADADQAEGNTPVNSGEEAMPEPDPGPRAVQWAEVYAESLKPDEKVILEAYVGPLPSFMSIGGSSLYIDFYERRNQDGGFYIHASLPTGESPNQVKSLPSSFQQSDLIITTDDGTTVGVGDYVRMEGKFSKASSEEYDYLEVTKIEKIEQEFDPAQLDRAIELTDEIAEDSTQQGSYVYMDASMRLGMFMGGFMSEKYNVVIDQKNNQYVNSAGFMVGEQAGQMKELEDGFTDEDFIIHDINGEAMNGGKGKFRLYGTWKQGKSYSEDDQLSIYFEVEEVKKL